MCVVARQSFTIEPAFAAPLKEVGLDSFGRIMAYAGGTIISKKDFRCVAVVSSPSPGGPPFYLKRFWRRSGLRNLLNGLSTMTWPRSTAFREWSSIRHLRTAGIPTPVPVGVGERSWFGLERESFFISLGVEGGVVLHTLLAGGLVLEPGQRLSQKRNLGVALADAVRALHQEGFMHGDLHAGHIVVVMKALQTIRVVLTDLELVQRIRRAHDVIRDLASLNQSVQSTWVSRADRVRFFKRYARVSRLGMDEKKMIRRIVLETARLEKTACHATRPISM